MSQGISYKLDFRDDRTDCEWFGSYTRGCVYCRGTRVWFMPEIIECIYAAHKTSEIENEILRIRDGGCSFPGDITCMRSEDLETLIKEFETYKPKLASEVKELAAFGNQIVIIDQDTPIQTAWVIKDILSGDPPKENILLIITELRKVLNFCEENDVTFDWV